MDRSDRNSSSKSSIRLTGGDATVVAGVGQHQMWTSQFWKVDRAPRWINSGGLGTMGFAVPAAIGAKAGMPDDLIFAIDGDGCFQMTFNELVTAAVEKIPVKIAVFNNGVHGMVDPVATAVLRWPFSGTILGDVIDYPSWPRQWAVPGCGPRPPTKSARRWRRPWRSTTGPWSSRWSVDHEEMVFPMVAGRRLQRRSS